MTLEKDAQRELGILQRTLKDEGTARALEVWVTSGDEAARIAVYATAPIAAGKAGAEWGRLIFLGYDDLAVADRMFGVVANGFDAPSAWLSWAMASVRLSGRYAAATRHLQRRLGREVRTLEVPRSTLTLNPPVRVYFPLLEAFLDAVAQAEPTLLDPARAAVIRSFAGPRVAEELPEYLSTLAGDSLVRDVSVPNARGTDWSPPRHVGPICVVLRELVLKNGVSHSCSLEVTIEKDEDAARAKADAAAPPEAVAAKPARARKTTKAVEEDQIDDAVALVRAYLEAEIAAQKATLLEPSDDRYRELEARAQSFLHVTPDNVHGLPFGRAAVPGGTMLVKEEYRANEKLVRPQLFSVAQHRVGGEAMHLAHVGSAFGPGAYGDRLHIARVGAELKIVGRSGCDPFQKRLSWEAAGGCQPGRLAKPVAVRLLEAPTNPVHLAHHAALGGKVPARSAPPPASASALPSPEAAAVLADYARLQERKEWKDANAAIGVFDLDERPAIMVADPAGLLAAKPLERAAPRDIYHVFWLPGANGRARALLLRRAMTRKKAAATAEAGGEVRIDTAAIAVLSEAAAQRLRTSTDGARLVVRLSEAPRGAFELETQHGVVTGFATLVTGDGVARATWLLDERGEIVALHILAPGAG